MTAGQTTGPCAACGAGNAPDARFCNQCGAPLTAAGRAGAGADGRADAERKQVTVLFSDLTGYTMLSERLDPEETREIMARIFSQAAEIVGRYGGRIEKFIGDAIMAIFGVPQAHEDDPVRAVRAALAMHQAVAALGPEVERRVGGPVALHSGINTGLVVTGELRFDRGTAGPLGDTINVAARLMGLAGPGEVLVGPETRRLVASAFDVKDLGEREIKGKVGAVAVARVVGPAARPVGPARFRGAFVGRREELGILLGAVDHVRDGRPAVVGIRGDAGTGKTRLVQELRARIGHEVQWVEGRAYPYAENIPYFPLIDLLNRAWGVDEADPPATARAKVTAGVASLVASPGELLPVVARLYDFEPPDAPSIDREAYPALLLGTVRRLLAGLARRGVTVVCLQDLHWADASTVALLRELSAAFDVPALLLSNFRPGYAPPAGTRVLELEELSSRQTRELLTSLLDGTPPAGLVDFVEQRSDGNPFYVEEVVNSLVETQVLVRPPEGWTLARPLAEVGVPTTIRGVIAARIDRLDGRRRRVLRDAAVVGREFLYAIVAEVTDESDTLDPSLAQLEAADLIRARSRHPEIEYVFKHALTQEVAYDGLLKSERQALHARVAAAMERVLRDRVPEFVETLAYHFARGGVTDRAIHYLIEAGRKCMARYAIEDAGAHYRAAYALLADRDLTAAEARALVTLLNEWSLVFYYTGDCREWRRLLERHQAVAEGVGDGALLGLYEGWRGMMLFFCEEHLASLAHLERAVRLAEEAGRERVLAHVEAWRAWTLATLGRTAEAFASGERAVALGRRFPDEPYLTFKPLAAIGFAAVVAGDLPRAQHAGEELLAIAARTSNTRAAVLGHLSLAIRHSLALEADRAVAAAERARAAAQDTTYRTLAAMYHALCLSFDARWEDTRRVVDETLPLAERLGLVTPVVWLRYCGAVAALGLGQPARGMAVLEAMRAAPTSPWAEACVWYALGLIHARIAAGEARADVPVLLRNLGFTLRNAVPARRHARRYLRRVADDPPHGIRGYTALAALELARLEARRRDGEGRRRAEQAAALFARQGADAALREARRLAGSPG